MEYLIVHGGSRGHALQYELMYDGKDDGRQLCGLIDVQELDKKQDYDERKLGLSGRKLVPSQPQVTTKLGVGLPTQSHAGKGLAPDSPVLVQNARIQPVSSQNPVVVVAHG